MQSTLCYKRHAGPSIGPGTRHMLRFCFFTLLIVAGMICSPSLLIAQDSKPAQAADSSAGESLQQKASYLIGFNFVKNMQQQGVEFDLSALIKGINDAKAGNSPPMTDEEIQSVQRAFERMLVQQQQARLAKAADDNMRNGLKFLKSNLLKEGVKELENGLQYKVIKAGEGDSPKISDTVKLNYKAKFTDGKIFDSSQASQPWSITVGAIGVRGLVNVIQKMKPGDVWEVYIPSELAFGIQGDPSGVVGPNQVLVYELELLKDSK